MALWCGVLRAHLQRIGGGPWETAAEALVRIYFERTRTSDRQIPALLEKEIRAYLESVVFAHGFLRMRCEEYRCISATDFDRGIPVRLQENQW